MPATTTAPHTPDTIPSTPTDQISGSGRPQQGVPLPSDLLERIRSKATSTAPASEVVQASGPPTGSAAAEKAAEPPKAPTPAPAAAKPAEAAKPATPPTPPTDDKPPKKEGIAQVREALERAEAAKRELEASHTATVKEKVDAYAKTAELEAKLKKWEERYATELEPQIKQLTEKEKRLAEAEERLRVRDYTATPQFHEAYVKPIAETHQEALQFIGELVANTEDGKQVPATQEHLNYVLGASNANEAARRAEQLFGPTFTGQLVNYRTRLRALGAKREEAIKRASVESETYFKQQQEQQMAEQARFRSTVEQRVQNYLVKPAEQDLEEQAAWVEGQRLSEQIANGVQDPEQRADLAARILALPRNERVQQVRLKRLTEELAATKAELARYQRTEPDVMTSGKGAPDAEQPNSMEAAKMEAHSHLMEVARKAVAGRLKPA